MHHHHSCSETLEVFFKRGQWSALWCRPTRTRQSFLAWSSANKHSSVSDGGREKKKKRLSNDAPTPSGSNAKHSRTFSPGNWLKILATRFVCLPSNGGTKPAGQADQETEDVQNNKVDEKEESWKKKKCNDVNGAERGSRGRSLDFRSRWWHLMSWCELSITKWHASIFKTSFVLFFSPFFFFALGL